MRKQFLFQSVIITGLIILFSIAAQARLSDDLKPGKMNKFFERNRPVAVLNFDVKIFFGRESEIAETLEWGRFYLLDESLAVILKNLDLRTDGAENVAESSPVENNQAAIEAAARTLMILRKDLNLGNVYGYGALDRPEYLDAEADILTAGFLLEETLRSHTVRVFQLNKMRSTARSLHRSGGYFIFGFGELGDDFFVWERPVNLMPGENLFEFDQYNSGDLTGE